ncbi:MAG: Uma2 family endonuclease [Candidatus Riflebacteria bacterium]|nr:Uma2 family endonuclease [Candidatus Riflebacteria bacterium]
MQRSLREEYSESKELYTYSDYLQWDDDKRWELIDGEAYCMTPSPTYSHQTMLGRLFRLFSNFLEGKKCTVVMAPLDVRFPKNGKSDRNTDTVLQPDLMVVCDEKKIDEHGIKGAPDLVVEITSPSTASRDNIKKKAVYEKHGVKEYWIVDSANKLVTIYKLGEDSLFNKPEIYSSKDRVKVGLFPDLEINLKDVFLEK